MATYVPGKGIKRTKVTRADGTAFSTLESVALARRIYTPEDGFTAVTEIYGHDPDLDGPRRPVDTTMRDLLAPLTLNELWELSETLLRGYLSASVLHPIMPEEFPIPGVDLTRHFNQNPIVWDLEKTHQAVRNEFAGRDLGCCWQDCDVCRHKSCVFCPACNPYAIAPNGEAYDTTAD